MVCKGCQRRRVKLKEWIRNITGTTDIFLKLDRHQDKWYKSLLDKIILNERKATARANDVQAYSIETAQKMGVMRDLIKDQKNMIRHRDEVVRELNVEIADLAERVNKLEQPDFEPIKYRIEDLKSG